MWKATLKYKNLFSLISKILGSSMRVCTILTLLPDMHTFPFKKFWEFDSTSRGYSFVNGLAYSCHLYSLQYNAVKCTRVTFPVRGVSVCACTRIPRVLGPKGVVVGLCLVSFFFSINVFLRVETLLRGCFPPLSLPIFPLFHQCDGCLFFFPLCWELMAGLPRFASHS